MLARTSAPPRPRRRRSHQADPGQPSAVRDRRVRNRVTGSAHTVIQVTGCRVQRANRECNPSPGSAAARRRDEHTTEEVPVFVIAHAVSATYPPRSEFTGVEQAALIGVLAFVVVAYLAPTIIAFVRRCPAAGEIAVLNILLGWTVIWWLVAFANSLQHVPRPTTGAQPHLRPGAPAVWDSAGWYPDPINPHRLRYHDGFRWTDALAQRR